MATGARQTNTFEEGLSRILNDIAALKRLPDAPITDAHEHRHQHPHTWADQHPEPQWLPLDRHP